MAMNDVPRSRRPLSRDGADDVDLQARRAVRRLLLELRRLRKALGMSLKDVGDLWGVASSTICHFEKSTESTPSFPTLYRPAAAVGMDLELRLKSAKGKG